MRLYHASVTTKPGVSGWFVQYYSACAAMHIHYTMEDDAQECARLINLSNDVYIRETTPTQEEAS